MWPSQGRTDYSLASPGCKLPSKSTGSTATAATAATMSYLRRIETPMTSFQNLSTTSNLEFDLGLRNAPQALQDNLAACWCHALELHQPQSPRGLRQEEPFLFAFE